jgi:hypothetical protein
MPVRPNDASHLRGIVAVILQDIEDILLNGQFPSGCFDLANSCLGAVHEVFAKAQIKDHGVVFALRLWIVTIDHESIAACGQCICTLDCRPHEY